MTDYTKYIPYMRRVLAANRDTVSIHAPKRSEFLYAGKDTSIPRKLDLQGGRKGHRVDMAKEFNLRPGDVVRVLYGRDAGKTGVLERILHGKNQVIVSGMNVIRSYSVKPLINDGSKETEVRNVSAPIHVTNIAPIDPVIKQPTRIKRRYSMTGECVRISKLSGCAMPDLPIPISAHASSRQLTRRKSSPQVDDISHFKTLVDLDARIRDM